MACAPGTMQDCYTGPDGTKGVGACIGGKQTCLPDGSGFGACAGEVLPAQEDCNTAAPDDDGDGTPPICSGDTLFSRTFLGFSLWRGPAIDADGNVFLL